MKTKEQKNVCKCTEKKLTQLKSKNGITLIALVVTIIVLIILAGVSISLVLGDNGIVTKAKEAKQNMQVAANEEQESLANLEVAIENEGGASGESGENPTPQITINDLKAGDYIKYDTGVTSVGENGVIICRVLYEASSEYGLQIISDKNVGSDITIGGSTLEEEKTAYNSAIETLNNNTIGAGKYLNTTYAVDARCVGSVPTVDEKSGNFTEKNKEVAGPVTMLFSYNGSTTIDCKNKDTNYTTDQTQMTNTNIWATGEKYWIASRNVTLSSSYCHFYVRCVTIGGDLNNVGLCDVYSDGHTYGRPYSLGLRPCFSLRSDIKITGGDGQSEATSYTMRYLEKNAVKALGVHCEGYVLVYMLHLDRGITSATKFKDIPEDWVCPLCGVGKDMFEKI